MKYLLFVSLFLLCGALEAQTTHPLGCSNPNSHSQEEDPHEQGKNDPTTDHQCHGQTGDSGQCITNSSGVVFAVICNVTVAAGRSFLSCAASANCPDGEQLNCGGPNNEAFSGVDRNTGLGYVVCRRDGILSQSSCS